MKRHHAFVLMAALGCGTTADGGQGSPTLPSAGVGPFRALAPEEVKGGAPFVLEDEKARYREPAVLREGEDTVLFAVARLGGRDVIVRTRATDDRTFYGTSTQFGRKPLVVLEPEASWEEALSGPSALRVGGELRLYYAGRDGIGLARSADGRSFRKEGAPVLGGDTRLGTWEQAPPQAPSVYLLPDGTFRMMYAAGTAIGEAESSDGVHWRRLDGPILAPSAALGTVAVGDPCVLTRVTPAGRFHVRVLYTDSSTSGATTIGFAARYGANGPLDRESSPAYSAGSHAAAPAVLELGRVSMLYVQQRATSGDRSFEAVAAAISPASAVLATPGDAPDEP